MTLDNCIKRYEIWASDDRISPNIREEHKQIAKWLNSYKKILEQELCEDAISRAEAILQIQRHGVGCFDPDEFSPEQAERFVINMLNELPSVKPEPKTGHWIKDSLWTKPYCSECGKSCIGVHGFDCITTDFCPNCGAKMEE